MILNPLRRIWLLSMLVCYSAGASVAQAPKRLRNADLAPQVTSQPFRVLPQSSVLSLASDTHFFYRVARQFPYYHAGYWMENLAELRPVKKLAINGRFIFYNPAMSYGVVSHFFFHPLFSFSWNDNLQDYGWGDIKLTFRLMDLDRQTLGAGLTLEQKEMSGVLLDLVKGDFRFRYLQDGTGGYDISGDVNYLQLDYKNNLAGLYAFHNHFGRAGFVGVYSTARLLDWLDTRAEVSTRHGVFAGLAGLSARGDLGESVHLTGDLQLRGYQSDFARDIKGRIEHDYLTIAQEDKPFTDSMNVFVFDDDVYVPAIRAGAVVRLWKGVSFTTDHELAIFHYKKAGIQNHYFFRYGLSVCQTGEGHFCAEFVCSNKFTSAQLPIDQNDKENKFSFGKLPFLGLEAHIGL